MIEARAALDAAVSGYDAVLTAATPGEAPRGLEIDRRRRLQPRLDGRASTVRHAAGGRRAEQASGRRPARRRAMAGRGTDRARALGGVAAGRMNAMLAARLASAAGAR
ncbi:MAG: hypothetical protein U1F37_07215 [Alphaproteobacteria bacterium]